jgi:hypothetical protein
MQLEAAEEPGCPLTIVENPSLVKLGEVERLLATKQQWCKGSLRDSDGRHCFVGAMKAAEARQIFEPVMLRAVREVSGKRYWRVESFNDDPRTTHGDVLRVCGERGKTSLPKWSKPAIAGRGGKGWPRCSAPCARALPPRLARLCVSELPSSGQTDRRSPGWSPFPLKRMKMPLTTL